MHNAKGARDVTYTTRCSHCEQRVPVLKPTHGPATLPMHPHYPGGVHHCNRSQHELNLDELKALKATQPTPEPVEDEPFCLTSVHPLETTSDFEERPVFAGHPPAPTEVETTFRHSGWQPTRKRVREALMSPNNTLARLEAFERCGSDAWVLRSKTDPDRLTIVASNCHDRFCLPCSQDRAALIKSNLLAILRAKQPPQGEPRQYNLRFVTLTILTRPDDDLRESITNLYTWFKALRSTMFWKRCVTGGAAFCEIKWMPLTQRWHPHLHVFTEGSWIEQDDLREEWRRITKTSHIVHVRDLENDRKAANYVAKYASKPLGNSFSDSVERIAEAIDALRGRKLCSCFGSWMKYRLLKTEPLDDWEPIGRYSTLVQRAQQGNADAIRIVSQLDERKSRRDAKIGASLRSASDDPTPQSMPP